MILLFCGPLFSRGQGRFRSSSSRPDIRRAAPTLPLRSADVPVTKQSRESREERCLFVRCAGKGFFIPLLSGFFFGAPSTTDWSQAGSRTGRGTRPQCSSDGHTLISRPMICNHNGFLFWGGCFSLLSPSTPQCCATCVTAEFCTTKLNQKEWNGYRNLYIYMKKIYRYINAATEKISGF